jgi:hypothetical protein
VRPARAPPPSRARRRPPAPRDRTAGHSRSSKHFRRARARRAGAPPAAVRRRAAATFRGRGPPFDEVRPPEPPPRAGAGDGSLRRCLRGPRGAVPRARARLGQLGTPPEPEGGGRRSLLRRVDRQRPHVGAEDARRHLRRREGPDGAAAGTAEPSAPGSGKPKGGPGGPRPGNNAATTCRWTAADRKDSRRIVASGSTRPRPLSPPPRRRRPGSRLPTDGRGSAQGHCAAAGTLGLTGRRPPPSHLSFARRHRTARAHCGFAPGWSGRMLCGARQQPPTRTPGRADRMFR